MCRLFGSRTRAPSGVSHELFHGANALRVQSLEHPDGWGLGWYENGAPRVVRSLTPAHGDRDFEKLSQFVNARTVVAHVRKASIGRVAQENTHPFQRGPWLFAHNGTLPGWEGARGRLEERIDPSLRAQLRGETDSERCFLLFLTRLRRRCDLEQADISSAAAALAETVALVRGIVEPAEAPASTTFLLTDGRLMLACRRGRTLFSPRRRPTRPAAAPTWRWRARTPASRPPAVRAPGGSCPRSRWWRWMQSSRSR